MSRNVNTGVGVTDYPQWQNRGYGIYSDCYTEGEYAYWFIAQYSSGIDCWQWKRWYLQSASPAHFGTTSYPGSGPFRALGSNTGSMFWVGVEPTTRDLFFVSYTDIYRAASTTWQGALAITPGTFAADETKALPGTRSTINFGVAWVLGNRSQWYPAFIDSHTLAIPANEGVYVVDWPSGSWILTYGKVGSGATYEFTINYDRIDALTAVTYHGRRFLAVSCTHGSRYWVHLIDTSDHTLQDSGDVTDKMHAPVISMAAEAA
jgi:hypothetical protein